MCATGNQTICREAVTIIREELGRHSISNKEMRHFMAEHYDGECPVVDKQPEVAVA